MIDADPDVLGGGGGGGGGGGWPDRCRHNVDLFSENVQVSLKNRITRMAALADKGSAFEQDTLNEIKCVYVLHRYVCNMLYNM